jgi:hypothetical protein
MLDSGDHPGGPEDANLFQSERRMARARLQKREVLICKIPNSFRPRRAVEQIEEYCEQQGVPNNTSARAQLAALKAQSCGR